MPVRLLNYATPTFADISLFSITDLESRERIDLVTYKSLQKLELNGRNTENTEHLQLLLSLVILNNS